MENQNRIVWLPDGEKSLRIRLGLLVSTEYTNMTDRRTDRRTPHDGISRGRASIARQKNIYRFKDEIRFCGKQSLETSVSALDVL